MSNQQIYNSGLTEVSTAKTGPLGAIRWEPSASGFSAYKYIQYSDGSGAVAGVAGDAVVYEDYAAGLVTGDITDGEYGAVKLVGAGILMADMADGEFGWVQIKGLSEVLANDVVAGAAGDALSAQGGADGTLDIADMAVNGIVVVGHLHDATASAQRMVCDFPF